MQTTDIEWTTFSANPIKYRQKSDGKVVWACIKTSPGCANCYSEATALRWDKGKLFNSANMEELEVFLCEKELKKMLTAKVIDKVQVAGSMCFVGDMTDMFGPWVPDKILDRLFAFCAMRPDVRFQFLTKRAERMASYWTDGHRNGRGAHTSVFVHQIMYSLRDMARMDSMTFDEVSGLGDYWPSNIWAGVSTEDQSRLDERFQHLVRTKARIRFLSIEPLIGPVNIETHLGNHTRGRMSGMGYCCCCPAGPFEDARHFERHLEKCYGQKAPIDWMIIGGESGHGARPCRIEWVRDLVVASKAAGSVATFVKQFGSNVLAGNVIDPIDQFPNDAIPKFSQGPDDHTAKIHFRSSKGADMAEWPADCRVREFPRRDAA